MEVHEETAGRDHRGRITRRERRDRVLRSRQRRRLRPRIYASAVRPIPAAAQGQRLPRHRRGACRRAADRTSPRRSRLGGWIPRPRRDLLVHHSGARIMSSLVLIVEDDVDVAEALALILEDAGYVAEIAPNGAEGIERLSRGPLPALILLDLMMPIMDGCEFRQVQRRMPEVASIPVVILSADAQAERKAVEMECTDCVMKPVELDRLLNLVRRHCGQL